MSEPESCRVRHTIPAGLCLLLAWVLAAGSQAAQDTTSARDSQLKEILGEKLRVQYEQNPKYKPRIDIYHKALDGMAGRLRGHLKKMEMEALVEELHRMQALARFAREEPSRASATPKDLRSKEVRKLEIQIRRLFSTLDDYKMSVPYEYRSGFEAATRDLEDWRNLLLSQIFGKDAVEPRPPGQPIARFSHQVS